MSPNCAHQPIWMDTPLPECHYRPYFGLSLPWLAIPPDGRSAGWAGGTTLEAVA
jgi:hypothetical protein